MTKLKRTYSLEAKTVKAVERLAAKTRRDFSAIIDLAVEAYSHIEEGPNNNGSEKQAEPPVLTVTQLQ